MNNKFFSLPQERQQAILNAGFHVFSQNSYKKSSMSEIADAAGISKSLLFHYFHNKKEFYLFLWKEACRITVEALEEHGCYEQTDLFESMCRSLKAKMWIMRKYPSVGNFTIRAFYEEDPAVCEDIQKSYETERGFDVDKKLLRLDPETFLPGLDIQMACQNMYWASEGYLMEMMRKGGLNVDEMEEGFQRLIEFWKSIYLRKGVSHGCD